MGSEMCIRDRILVIKAEKEELTLGRKLLIVNGHNNRIKVLIPPVVPGNKNDF